MKRDQLADRLKGYACLLVLFGHVIIGLRTSSLDVPTYMVYVEKFIWSFHIDLFMFLSGYVYNITGKWHSKGNRFKFIGSKLLNLGVPYVVFSAVYIIINSLTPGVNNANSITDILNIWHTPVAQYWFLYSLFFLFVFWALLSFFLKDWMITVLLFAGFITAKVMGIDLGVLDSSFNCVLAFGLGTCFSSLNSHEHSPILKIGVIEVHIAVVFVCIYTGAINKFIGLDDVCTVLGIIASIFFISLITKLEFVARFLDYVCKYSFPIYLLHTIFTSALRIVLIKIGVTNYLIHIVLATLLGLFAPVFIAYLTSKAPVIDFIFYPSRSIKRLKKKDIRRIH